MPLFPAVLLSARLDYEPVVATVERRVESMGTTLDLVVRMKDREQALKPRRPRWRKCSASKTLLTTWKPGGELARIDAAPVGKPVAVSAELVETSPPSSPGSPGRTARSIPPSCRS